VVVSVLSARMFSRRILKKIEILKRADESIRE